MRPQLNISFNSIGGYYENGNIIPTPEGPKAIADALLVNTSLTKIECACPQNEPTWPFIVPFYHKFVPPPNAPTSRKTLFGALKARSCLSLLRALLCVRLFSRTRRPHAPPLCIPHCSSHFERVTCSISPTKAIPATP